VFQAFFNSFDPAVFNGLIHSDSVVIDNRARGGRSTRTFFQEGRWRSVYATLKKDDLVLIQFGHNDASEKNTERYVNIEGYKEFLRLYVHQTREKSAIPIILTPVCRNYPWKDDQLENVHGEYPDAAKAIASELDVLLIDLNQLSMKAFSVKGKEYVTQNYFMNIPANTYEGYPEGLTDNTHFQPEGAEAVASLVFEALKDLQK
ncbi:MAG: rhamnogalacturonan acetylesterase, partial [Cyclobacteriaceae bacterium]